MLFSKGGVGGGSMNDGGTLKNVQFEGIELLIMFTFFVVKEVVFIFGNDVVFVRVVVLFSLVTVALVLDFSFFFVRF